MIDIINFEDTDDGGAIMTLSLSPEAARVFIEKGILAMIQEHIDQRKE